MATRSRSRSKAKGSSSTPANGKSTPRKSVVEEEISSVRRPSSAAMTSAKARHSNVQPNVNESTVSRGRQSATVNAQFPKISTFGFVDSMIGNEKSEPLSDNPFSPASPLFRFTIGARSRLASPDIAKVNERITKIQKRAAKYWILLLATMVAWVGLLAYFGYTCHWEVPKVVLYGSRDVTDSNGTVWAEPIFSEAIARDHIDSLVTKIGIRVVGTKQEDMGKNYILDQLQKLKTFNDNRGVSRFVENFEIDVQVADGSHRFDLMGFPILKAYSNITNIIVKLSCGIHCDNNGAILMNAHYDSTIVSPGASDDGAGIAIMLEVARILVNRDKEHFNGLKNSLILLFNGAEETLQDASHAFVTQHTLSKNVRGVINMEAMGQNGKEILFQANSNEMVKAYSKVPHPHGSVLSNDVFRTGLVLSDTDFRQFVEYGDYVGLDMAFYQNSYYYHTMLDVAETIQYGSIQNFGDNVMAMLDYLLFESNLADIKHDKGIIYFDFLGMFFVFCSWATAVKIYFVVFVFALGCLYYSYVTETSRTVSFLRLRSSLVTPEVVPNVAQLKKEARRRFFHNRIVLVIAFTVGIFLTIEFNILSSIISYWTNRRMSWFSREWYPLVFFFGTSLIGISAPHIWIRSKWMVKEDPKLEETIGTDRFERILFEHAALDCFTIIPCILLILTIAAQLGSSYIMTLYLVITASVGLISTLSLTRAHPLSVETDKLPSDQELTIFDIENVLKKVIPPLPLWTYFALLCSVPLSTELVLCVTNLFTPITGRIGPDAPTDIIISVIAGILWNILTFGFVPLVYRAPRKFGKVMLKALVVLTCIIQVYFLVNVHPFDAEHPKRIYVSYIENPETGLRKIYLAHADPVRINEVLASVGSELGVEPVLRTKDETDMDWLSLYPFSHFMEGYEFDVSHFAPISPPMSHLPEVTVEGVYDKATDTRNVTIQIYYPNYMWVVVQMDADIVDWSLADKTILEPGVNKSYMIRNAGGYGTSLWKFSVVFKGNEPVPLTLLAVETDGFHELLDIQSPPTNANRKPGDKVGLGMKWIWSDRWGSAEVLSRIESSAPEWTSGLYMAEIQLNRTI